MRYFAYGSNLLTRRLRNPARAPSAVALGTALAPGFVMRFHKVGTDGSGKCTLIPTGDDGDAAYGVLYEFADSDLAGLDREEGVHLGGYARRSLRLRLPNGGTAEAMTYIAGGQTIDASCLPFDWYRDLVVAGAREHGLPSAYIRELKQIPAAPDPDTARAVRARRLLGSPDRKAGHHPSSARGVTESAR